MNPGETKKEIMEGRKKERERKMRFNRMPEGPQTVVHIRVAIRHFCCPVDSGRRRDREGGENEVRDEEEESRSRNSEIRE